MRIKINGEYVDDVREVQFRSSEASDFAGLVIIIVGAIACVWWWFLWI